ncbi:hypothetical protein BC938DRAFT_481869 [Jimgerdemannia flammicorona]|uniref:Uncharacterized protein n=1 Tax=Jimgerdemannia flammicorona TaxID=994334 RepID=A0A433QWS4_9FUNG|nr:hypothetical protein BC938DRAFT_481869 [Jimgerdemannia flammicorona]
MNQPPEEDKCDSAFGRWHDPNKPPPEVLRDLRDYSKVFKPPPPLDHSLSKKLLEELAHTPQQDLAKIVQTNRGRAIRIADGFNLILGVGADLKPLTPAQLVPRDLKNSLYSYDDEKVIQIGYLDGWNASKVMVGCKTGKVIVEYFWAWLALADKFAGLLQKKQWPFGKWLGLGGYEGEKEGWVDFTSERGITISIDEDRGQAHV